MVHEHAHRLIYAADLSFSDCHDFLAAEAKAWHFLDKTTAALKGSGIVFKGDTIFRMLGARALKNVSDAGLKIFADYKLFDVQDTCANDFSWLRLVPELEILTICERVHPEVFTEAARVLPDTVIAPIYPLTDLTDSDFQSRGEIDRAVTVNRFFRRVLRLSANGIICSPTDLKLAPDGFGKNREIITPAIRPEWYFEPGDKNAVNALTPRKAIEAGASRLVIGSPLRKNGDLRGNVERVLDEMDTAWHRHYHG